jgi:integrase
MTKAYAVVELTTMFLAAKELQGGMDLRRYYEKHLQRFSRAFGDIRADVIRAINLQSIKDDMIRAGYAEKTINHDVVAVKAMLNWAMGLEYIPAVHLKGVKTCPLGPPPDKSMPVKAVRKMVLGAPEPVRSWLAISYLCLMRPSEVVRCVQDEGEWVETGVFRLDRGKIDKKARLARHVVFSPEAMKWRRLCEPVWSRLDTYSAAVRRECGPGGPHALRHSAATHLAQLGVDRADIDLLLGHAPPRVSLTYAPIMWQPLRRTAARITLRSVSSPRRG